ncbi:MAG: MFS transporter [Rhodospirillaceae bacterium]|jgi:MFS family permease|nr:MFS transporter [Rhodospirillaceae bacterium]MBT6140326.1 MFS transporter [Rhodospirillaceae bacterium]
MPYSRFLFLNIGHALDHLFILLFPAVAALAASELQEDYATLLALTTGSFIAFGACSLPAGWLGDRWSRENMMTVFFIGIGSAAILTGMAQSYWQIAVALTSIGVFAAIYHPVGLAMVSKGGGAVGQRLGVNGLWGNLGVAASALSIGAFADYAGWRAAFFLLGTISILIGFAWIRVARSTAIDDGAAKKKTSVALDMDWRRALLVVAASTIIGGFIFNSMTVSLPKVLGDRLDGFALSATEVGAIATGVYTLAAFSQLIVGRAIDRWRVKPIFLGLVAGQAVALYLAINTSGWAMVAVSVLVMVMVFGQIPINDFLIARYTPEHLRARVFSVKYVLSFTVSAAAVPSIAWLYSTGGGFPTMFTATAIGAVIITAAVALLPSREPNMATEAGDD